MNRKLTKLGIASFLWLALSFLTVLPAWAQLSFIAGPTANGNSALNRGPNGSVNFQRTAAIYLGSEFPGMVAGPINSVGFSILTAADTATVGNIKLYMVNTTDATFIRSTTWATLTTSPTAMTLVYDGPLTIPKATGFFNITLQTPFAYTGGNFYLAYEWSSISAKSTASATYNANNDLASSLRTITGTSLTAVATLSGSSAFRPVLNLGFPTPANDATVQAIYSLGKLSLIQGANSDIIKAVVKNTGSTPFTNLPVTLAITGANTANQTVTIPTLAPGATQTISFATFTPTAAGSNTLTVTIPADNNNTNNSVTATQLVTANTLSYAASSIPGNGVGFGTTGNSSFLVKLKATGNNPVTINSVRAFLWNSNTSIGQTVYGIVVDSSGNLLGRSANFVITGGDLDGYITLPITTTPTSGIAPTVTNSDYYVGLAQPTYTGTQFFPLGFQNETPQRTGVYYTWGLAAATPTKPVANTANRRFMIEAVLSGTTMGLKTDLNPALVSVFPNPGNGILNVSAKDLKGGQTLTLEVCDLSGRVVYTGTGSKTGATVNLGKLASGVYMLKVATNSDVAIKRIVIQ